MSILRSLIQILICIGLGIWLLACDAGPGTVANPNLGSSGSGYNGPPAKDAATRAFELHFWTFLKEDNRCGQCHGSGIDPQFVDRTDVNKAYTSALSYVDLQDPSSSLVVTQVAGGHHCWLGTAFAACASNVEQMITNWANNSNVTSARLIQLTPPQVKEPGDAKSFPLTALTLGTSINATAPGFDSFALTVHPLLTQFCLGCHRETATTPIAPFFANADPESAFAAAKAKMDIDTPSNSRFVVRLRQESHNCWTTNCATDAQTMEDAIATFASGIDPTPVDPLLVTSKALNLLPPDGIIAAGGSRHELNQVAIWEFKSGLGSPTAFDTSGIDPAVDLTLIGSVNWLGGYGLDFSGGSASANTANSKKLHDYIQATGEYAIEAWVIPANVTQQNRNIVSYSISDTRRNFTLGQNMYDYNYYNRIDDPDPDSLNGEPFLSSSDSGEEILQASLQHVVVNYDPATGRSIYVNGALVFAEPVNPSSIGNNIWNDTYQFILGNEQGGTAGTAWNGQLRLAAIHNRILTPAQIVQNFDVGVGEKYFLLFYVGHRTGVAGTYIMFEVSQFDSFSYLFSKPTFINLDPAWTPLSPIVIKGMRIGINGKEALAGQAYASLDVTINSTDYDPQFGQKLASVGTIIALEKNAATDEFFLTFEEIGIIGSTQSHVFDDPQAPVPADPADPSPRVASDIGVRTFEEINSTIATITGVRVTNSAVDGVYDDYIQQLPTVEAIDAFLPSHQMAIAQLVLTSCSELVEGRGAIAPGAFFPGFNFNQTAQAAFGPPPPSVNLYYPDPNPADPTQTQSANRNSIIDPLLAKAMNVIDPLALPGNNNLSSQPNAVAIRNMLGSDQVQVLDAGIANTDYASLIDEMLSCKPVSPDTTCVPINDIPRTAQIVKAVCAAAVGGAVMLVQ